MSHPEQSQDDVARELLAMSETDQAMREAAAHGGAWDSSIDERNTTRLKAIVAQYGWPHRSQVGKEATRAAWLLAQHADAEPGFQALCLELMKGLPEGEVGRSEIAYLEDRVRVNTGRPQLYGTQFHDEGGALEPQPIENVERVDERRKSVGLGSLAEYAALLKGIDSRDKAAENGSSQTKE